ncbi:unnamed protein product [Ascophyllum nodosum]
MHEGHVQVPLPNRDAKTCVPWLATTGGEIGDGTLYSSSLEWCRVEAGRIYTSGWVYSHEASSFLSISCHLQETVPPLRLNLNSSSSPPRKSKLCGKYAKSSISLLFTRRLLRFHRRSPWEEDALKVHSASELRDYL